MQVSHDKVRQLCERRGVSVAEALRTAKVSRNAYYSLCRKTTILPRTVTALADRLGVRPTELVEDNSMTRGDAEDIMKSVARIVREHPGVDPDNVRHTLILLRMDPVERLRRALQRGRKQPIR